jgi:hypothetical protein
MLSFETVFEEGLGERRILNTSANVASEYLFSPGKRLPNQVLTNPVRTPPIHTVSAENKVQLQRLDLVERSIRFDLLHNLRRRTILDQRQVRREIRDLT